MPIAQSHSDLFMVEKVNKGSVHREKIQDIEFRLVSPKSLSLQVWGEAYNHYADSTPHELAWQILQL